jgi:hypothetical protein
LDQLDNYYEIDVPCDQVFLNPCHKHYICGYCIRQSLKNTPENVLKIGQGNFPCLGDSNCKNNLGHITTTFIYQLKCLFNDIEWRIIMEILKNMRQSCKMIDNYHPYISPLIKKNELCSKVSHDKIVEILNQECPYVKCPICAVVIQKTTDCYSIRHCDWEVCWMCHKIDRRLPADHWKTCPRYDFEKSWKSQGYLCKEGSCYDENKTCVEITHKNGIEMMNRIRKSFQLHYFWDSLSISVIDHIKTKLSFDDYEKLKMYLNVYDKTCNVFKH